jgi:hypothetical protein
MVQYVQILVAVLSGGLAGAVVTFVLGRYFKKQDMKKELFLLLLSNRKTAFASEDLTKGLNTIDALFKNNKKVIAKYHELRDFLISLNPGEKHEHRPVMSSKFVDVLVEIAGDLKYKIHRDDLDKCLGRSDYL